MKVLVSDKLVEEGLNILKKAKGVELDYKPGLAPAELKAIIGNYDALVIRSGTKVTAEIIEAATNLKVIGRAGIGVDNVDLPAATRKGIIVENTPFGNSVTTAEHAIAMMFAVSRKIPQATASMKLGKWEKNKFEGNEISDKTLGIIGVGNIGKLVAMRALGLKMKVLGYDPFLTAESAEELGIKPVSINDLFKNSDYITIHTPVNDATRNLLNKDAFKQMRKGIYIINCARGGIVNEKDLEWAIKEGIVKGAALDVFEQEPPPADHPLLSLEQVICTPHLGAATGEAQYNVAIQVAEQIADFLTTGAVTNAVNFPSVSADLAQILKPYISLGEKMAKVLGSIINGAIKTVEIEYAGEIAKHPVGAVTVSALKGLFEPILEDVSVNYVNARLIAKDRGVEVKEIKSSKVSNFNSVLNITATTDKETRTLTGTIFGTHHPRIVRIDDYYLEALPEGNMIIVHNHDRPGVIGSIGTLLGKNKVNISRMQLGLSEKTHEAIAIYNVDSTVDTAILAEIAKLPNIISVKKVSL